MTIYTAKTKTSKNWRKEELSWGQFLDRLREPKRTGETMQEYLTMSTEEKGKRKECAGGFVAGELKDGRRKTENVLNRTMITLDADHAKPGAWKLATMLNDYKMCCYSTHSHTPEKPRLRWVIPTDRPMTPEEYPAVARRMAEYLDIETMDQTTYETARLMYWPTCAKDGEYEFHEQDGPELCVDDVLHSYGPGDAWKDSALWPKASDEKKVSVHQPKKKAGDPREK
ncbi:MAG: hypothetical protein IIZ34_04385, partial [Eubacterium sp.]|nr:hypothetical protein [Eubacterium sp.]